jgi:hypothetical protein
MKETVDILLFGGQSNMQGQTECLPEENEPVEGAWEYRQTSDELIPLCHPVGEDLGDIPEDRALKGAHEGRGSLIPDACRAYVAKTGRKVVAIHVACGGTGIGGWLKGTERTHRYEFTLNKIKAGLAKIRETYDVGHVAYLWLQGESDAIGGTTGEAYAAMMTDFKNAMKAEIGFEVFGIIKVGYFCGTVSWMRPMVDKESGLLADEAIMEAQERLVREDPDFVMLTRVCPAMSLDDKWINPFAEGHYNNAAMAVIGTEVGEALGEILASRTEA